MSYSKSILLSTAHAVALCTSAHAANSVVVESRTFSPNQPSCTVGVFLQNDVDLIAILLTLEIRTISGDAFYRQIRSPLTSFFGRQLGRRLDRSGLGSGDPFWGIPAHTTQRFYESPSAPTCSGPTSHTWSIAVDSLSGVSPDGVLYAAVGNGDMNIYQGELYPGADPNRRDSASFILLFETNDKSGCFEIDSACVSPNSHTVFVDRNSSLAPFNFTKGTVCIDPACYHCYCLGNPHECPRGSVDIVDVLQVINVAFRQRPAIADPSVVCPYSDTDLNCDGTTDVIDLTRVIQVAFGAMQLLDVACNPCP
jgi:hypothetical protein